MMPYAEKADRQRHDQVAYAAHPERGRERQRRYRARQHPSSPTLMSTGGQPIPRASSGSQMSQTEYVGYAPSFTDPVRSTAPDDGPTVRVQAQAYWVNDAALSPQRRREFWARGPHSVESVEAAIRVLDLEAERSGNHFTIREKQGT